MSTFTQTSTYNQPTLAYTIVPGLTYPGGSTDDPQEIPLVLDQYTGPTRRANLNVISTMPIVQENFTYGGVVIGEGTTELPRTMFGGYIDTPVVPDAPVFPTPGILVPDIQHVASAAFMTWADFIIMCLEGRVSATWQRFDPLWFRDPYGRQFTRVRMLDFTASYVEGIPGRTNFTATLLAL